MRLLFLNSLKGLKKKKIQMVGIILMVMLSIGIYTVMNASLSRLENRYYRYVEEQNVEDFSFSLAFDLQKDINIEQFQRLKKEYLQTITTSEQQTLLLYESCLKKTSKECNPYLYHEVSQLFTKYHVLDSLKKQKVDSLADKYQFSYEETRSKIVSSNQKNYKALPYQDQTLNVPYLVEGKFPSKKNEVTILPNFAKANGLEIGNIFKVGEDSYQIVGFAYAPDYIYPTLNISSPIFDERNNNIMYMIEETYQEYKGTESVTYSGKFHESFAREAVYQFMMTPHELGDTPKNKLEALYLESNGNVITDMEDTMRFLRINMIQGEFETDRIFANYFLYLLLGVSVFIILIIMKKRIEDERLQIGVLKALGYRANQIAVSYLTYPIVGSLIGSILGYGIGLLLQPILTSVYLSSFNVPIGKTEFSISMLGTVIVIPIVILTILSYLIALFLLRKKPLKLLKEGSNLKVNLFSKLITKITSYFPFNMRFKYSLASRSLGKLLIVTLTSFCTGMLVVLFLIGINLFRTIIDQTLGQLHFDYMIYYSTPQMGELEDEDLLFSSEFQIVGIKDASGNQKDLSEKEETLSITGVDQHLHYLEVKDKNDKNLLPLLSDNGIIVNEHAREFFNLEVGDVLELTLQEQTYSLKILGFSSEYMGLSGYIDRTYLSELYGFKKPVYLIKYSNHEEYGDVSKLALEERNSIATIVSFDDLERNIRKQVETMNGVIYVIIFFAAFMAFVILAVIANIVVEENKKIISLMKVMGYSTRNISSIVLNIYTPIIIFAYLLAIPAMIGLLKFIISQLADTVGMTIPITISPVVALLGLVGLLVAYYSALYLSRRSLNKIPLAIALKRE